MANEITTNHISCLWQSIHSSVHKLNFFLLQSTRNRSNRVCIFVYFERWAHNTFIHIILYKLNVCVLSLLGQKKNSFHFIVGVYWERTVHVLVCKVRACVVLTLFCLVCISLWLTFLFLSVKPHQNHCESVVFVVVCLCGVCMCVCVFVYVCELSCRLLSLLSFWSVSVFVYWTRIGVWKRPSDSVCARFSLPK